jgi:CheY-like chemotaxis protein
MRTPLNAIIGMTVIAKRSDDFQEQNHALSKIGDASTHLLGIINDVLDMAKIEAHKLELVPVEYNFDRMLQNVMSVVTFRIDEKKQTLTVNIDKAIPRFVVGDDQRLAQVITNILGNATKFTSEEGEILFEVFLVEEIENICTLRIEVTDNGIGIDPEHHERLFSAFEQAESGTSREYGGSGLGLVISKRIIELMGGNIWVDSEPGKGAKFSFTVNVQRGSKNLRSMLAPGTNWKNMRILTVDESVKTRNMFRGLLNQLGIHCDIAGDGSKALRFIEENAAYDMFFISSSIPGMDSIELVKKIKFTESVKPSVVIITTQSDWTKIRIKAQKAGVDKHLIKPLFSSMIVDCINECLSVEGSDTDYISTHGEFKGKRMLVVEDVEINRDILVALLDNTGIKIDCAENGKEAVDIIESAPNKYDIIFMDMQMPVMGGIEATRILRTMPALKKNKLPIVAMTANVFKEDIEECLAAGMDGHLGKPLDIDKVFEELRKHL